MTISTARREFTWIAMTCRLEQTDVYIGLGAGLDDLCARRLAPEQIAAFPMQRIKVTSANGASMPLRLYSVRDPSIVQIEPTNLPPLEKGYAVVRLTFRLPSTPPSAVSPQATGTGGEVEAVMGFLVTIGLKPDEEEEFFTTVVSEFLERTWMTVPKLLREIGCAHPTHIDDTDGETCG